jgi:hypothetical protein
MTQEQKDLLLKDLCCRLPYGVKVQTTYINPQTKERKDIGTDVLSTVEISMLIDGYEEHKPYLFPLSSMTEEQWRELFEIAGYEVREEDCGRHTEIYYYDMVGHENTLHPNYNAIDWFNANHFDYRGLIPMDLGIDATGLNIY